MNGRSAPIGNPPRGARREFATHASRRRSRLAVQSQPWAAQRTGGAGLFASLPPYDVAVFHDVGWLIEAMSLSRH